ncbi:GntR family transcriptional regulator, partial [Escherichia coli]
LAALKQHDGNSVDKAMTHHLQQIDESVLLIRRENNDWFSEE